MNSLSIYSFCITGVKAEGVTAKIGDNEYNTLDAAIEEAKDGDVIELINDGTVTPSALTPVIQKHRDIKANKNNFVFFIPKHLR